MNDPWRIDSHKLLFHPERVSQWQATGDCFPIYAEISPTGACNHRCTFCGLDFMRYRPRFLDTEILAERIQEMRKLGLKSIMFAGEGEPFLHRDMAEIAVHAHRQGLDVAFTTNGVLLKPETLEKILPSCEWIKVSVNAGSAATYGAVHRTSPSDFQRVFDNLAKAVAVRCELKAGCTLGVQTLLLPENRHEIESLAARCREIGLDYLVVKPFSQHPQSLHTAYADIGYDGIDALDRSLDAYRDESFHVIVRTQTIRRWNDGEKGYRQCLALPFWTYIDAGGDVWGCSMYMENDRFRFGNIHKDSFAVIWEGEPRKRFLNWCAGSLDASSCRINCRMDPVNIYLQQLTNPPPHVNFI